ncbi:MAG: glycosyltransferase [Alphaproteobacteria bacterium]|nr:MAG: glycosyltransferase [Alphaproteobacteria bacterium]
MPDIAADLKRTRYFFDDRHTVLSDAQADVFGPNVGADGRNLTIVFLSLNRARLSIRLLDSIAAHLVNFAGEVLIGDNGSDPAEIEELRTHLRRLPYRWRLIEFGTNYGVAGGRNRLMQEARTDWVVSLDNDIYFIANPIRQIQEELGTLGCHFMSFPLLNPDGATVYSHGASLQTVIQNGRPRLTINPIAPGAAVDVHGSESELESAFLSTFLFGGASVLHRHSFSRLGAFDEGMLIGFEDIDFSLRLFRAGMKVGTSAARCLVHDHAKSDTASDADYERKRFARKTLHDSARHLEAKSGFRVWGEEVENWLRDNEVRQGWATPDAGPPRAATDGRTPGRPRIALITDTDNWAFANIARQLKRHLGDRFAFEVFPLVNLGEIEKSRWLAGNCTGFFADGGASALGMALVAAEEFDIVHVFWREFLTIIDTPLLEDYAQRLGVSYADFRRRFIDGKIISTCVYDHLFLEPADIVQRERIFTQLTRGYYVASPRLRKIYEQIPALPKPAAVLPDGVDLSLFRPKSLERFDTAGMRPVRVGWVGHSAWASTLEDFKGVNTILKPALAELQNEGMQLVADFADRKEKFIPHLKMPDYYAGIDVLVCTSKIEGTPNPVLEAMACGVPVITTDVGIVPEVFGPKQREFILPERSTTALKQALRRLVSEPARFRALSNENLESIKGWDWTRQAEGFADYFDALLEPRRVETGEVRTKMCMLPFSSPSMEPDGSIRLCSASSIFAYYDQTNMGNCRADGLAQVWSGERYRNIRRALVTGQDLKPFCASCEYRFDAPAWMMQLHLGLHAYHHGVRTDEILALIARRIHRYEEYRARAPALNIAAYAVDDALRAQVGDATARVAGGKSAPLAPEELLDAQKLPIYMDFNTLNRCNVSCTMCPPAIRHDKLGIARDPYYRLTLNEYQTITEGVRISSAHFVGAYAEPLLNKDIFALIAHARAQGAFTAITTNATALSRNFGEKLLDAGLDMMTVSLHGASARTAEAIMLKSDFARIVDNIRGFQQLKRERGVAKPEIYFNYVAQKSNAAEMPDFIDLAHALDVRFVNFIHLIDGDEAVDASENLASYPDLLVPTVLEARERAKRRGIVLYVSPAYDEIVARHARKASRPDTLTVDQPA